MTGPCIACGADSASCGVLASGSEILRCPVCGLASLFPPTSAALLDNRYRAYYRDDNAGLHPLTVASYIAVMEELERHTSVGRILDVGCGAGQFLEVAAARGWRAEGIEISESAVRYVRARGLVVHTADLIDWKSPDKYDAITMFEVLEHLRSPLEYLQASRSLLKPHGLLYLTTPNFDGLSRRLLGSRWRVISPEHLAYFSPSSLRALMSRAGLVPLRVESRNLDLADLRLKLLHRSVQNSNNQHTTTQLRESIARHASLRFMKRTLNKFLGFTALGDTLEAWATSLPPSNAV